MARLEFEYKVEEENTEKQGGSGGILPHMYAKLEAEAMEILPTEDNKGHRLNITFSVIGPEQFDRRKFWADWTISHPDTYNYGRYKYGKPMFDRFMRAAGIDLELFEQDPDTDHLILKSFVAEVGIQIGSPVPGKPGEFYKDKNQIDRFFYPDDNAKEPIPELGIIGDGTQGKKRNVAGSSTPANDNRPSTPAARAAAPAEKGKSPWAKKAA